MKRRAFTLIELLVVIAIIAILAVVVVLTLNPAQLLAQSRDANRVSDMSTLTDALNLYTEDQSGGLTFNLGTSSVAYLSTPDPSATSTAGTDCSHLGFPSGGSSHCVASSTLTESNGSGWIPVNFSSISQGSPIASLPTDPTNQSSSGLYYTYQTNGSQYQLFSLMESTKYKQSVSGPLGSGIDVQGSNAGSPPIGWWPLNEGTGTIAYDISGNGNNGTWYGTPAGTSGYYSSGVTGGWAGDFDGDTDYVAIPNKAVLGPSQIAITAWVNSPSWSDSSSTGSWPCPQNIVSKQRFGDYSPLSYDFDVQCNGKLFSELGTQSYGYLSVSGSSTLAINTWYYVAMVFNGTNAILYVNGKQDAISTTIPNDTIATNTYGLILGCDSYACPREYRFYGLISDVRIYNRALSAAEIEAIYNAK